MNTVNPDELHGQIAARLSDLEGLLKRVKPDGTRASPRELMQARSRTALSCRLHARLYNQHHVQPSDAAWMPPPTQDAFFDNLELVEHMLSFLGSATCLARAGAVSTSWYLASRMQTLWEAQLRRSGWLIGFDSEPLPLPLEEDHTLFETVRSRPPFVCKHTRVQATPPPGSRPTSHGPHPTILNRCLTKAPTLI